jgi:NAD+ kinase
MVLKSQKYERAFRFIIDILRESEIEFKIIDVLPHSDTMWGDFIISLGDDSDILTSLHSCVRLGIPILGVNETDGESFLTEVGLSEFRLAIKEIVAKNFNLEDAMTLNIRINSGNHPPAINEIAIFPHRSATLLEYSLKVNGEEIWTDSSDGVIVATPTGSTAYSMSAGGPMVLPGSGVFTIVSVNSLDVTRRPLIVPENSIVTIDNITSKLQCEVIIDGIYRSRINNTVEVSKSNNPALLIRLPKESPTVEKIKKKVLLARDLLSMPPSAKLMLKTLEYEGPMSRRDIIRKTMLPERTASLAFSILIGRGLIKRKSSLKDGREKVYCPV